MSYIAASDVLYDLNLVNIDDNLSYIYKDGYEAETYPKMLDTHFSFPENLPSGKSIVFDIGGTNLRSAIISFDENKKAKIEKFTTTSISLYMNDYDTFISYLVSHIKNLKEGLGNFLRIRICFSYPFESTKNHDGRIIQMTKNVDMKGCEGKLLAKPIKDALTKDGIDCDIAIVNDATAAVLYVKTAISDIDVSSAMVYGLIIGTGNNMALLKTGGGVCKIINTELGQTPIGNNRVLENVTSGKYIYNVVNQFLAEKNITLENTQEVSELLNSKKTSDDVKAIIRDAIKKIAASAAYLIDRIIRYQMNVEKKTCAYINIEGTCYYSLPGYRENFTQILESAGKSSGYSVNFIVPCENAIMIASATA